DARVPNGVVADAVKSCQLEEFKDYLVVKSEVKYGDSRLDLLLGDCQGQKYYVEVKSVTLVVDGTARFPDAPTERGARHLNELIRASSEGNKSAVVFLIQREDAIAFSPNDATDPAFGKALREAGRSGVEIYAYICKVDLHGTKIIKRVPALL
ncbi:MAG TPA: DNA/RNA nuclease SfsA, partial [Verrucomicrobiae bacterium]|nr:DNA/RNA nuclease SfsA [Verrucomicrobiae bacterium]